MGTVGDIVEGSRSGGTGLQVDGLRLFEDDGLGLGIDEFQRGLARERLLAGVEDAGGDLTLVTVAEEARHVGLDHHILLGDGLTLDAAVTHILGMGQTHQSPGSQTLGEGKLQRDMTFAVGGQLGIEEGGLVEVLAHLHLLSGSLAVGVGCLGSKLLDLVIGHHSRLRHHHGSLLHHHVGILKDSPTREAAETATVSPGEHLFVEIAETQVVHTGRAPRFGQRSRYRVLAEMIPEGAGKRQEDIGRERPLVPLQHVEALVVERCHQLGISRTPLGILHTQGPLFLLAGEQTITEGGPLQTEFLVRQRTLDLCLVGIALAVLHPGKGEQQSIAVFLLVSHVEFHKLVAPVEGPTFQDLIACEDTIENMDIVVGRAHLQPDGLAVVGEL